MTGDLHLDYEKMAIKYHGEREDAAKAGKEKGASTSAAAAQTTATAAPTTPSTAAATCGGMRGGGGGVRGGVVTASLTASYVMGGTGASALGGAGGFAPAPLPQMGAASARRCREATKPRRRRRAHMLQGYGAAVPLAGVAVG